MDGFKANVGVIVLAATNRPEVLDRALLRPGRFDRQVVVDAPDMDGREAILKVHARESSSLTKSIFAVSRATAGFGRGPRQQLNEAALLAARRKANGSAARSRGSGGKSCRGTSARAASLRGEASCRLSRSRSRAGRRVQRTRGPSAQDQCRPARTRRARLHAAIALRRPVPPHARGLLDRIRGIWAGAPPRKSCSAKSPPGRRTTWSAPRRWRARWWLSA